MHLQSLGERPLVVGMRRYDVQFSRFWATFSSDRCECQKQYDQQSREDA